jgi:hypothetical protein
MLFASRCDVATRYSKGLGLCFGIRSMLPVMAEAFVNLLLFALMRPELKSNQRLRDNTIRQPIDIRIMNLSVTCTGFESQVDYKHAAFKAYHTLVNERNDLLHGDRFRESYLTASGSATANHTLQRAAQNRHSEIPGRATASGPIRLVHHTLDADRHRETGDSGDNR